MPLDISGYDSVLKTPAFELLLDRGKNGFAVLELRSFGEGVLEEKVPLGIGQAEYEFFQPRDDLALNTVAFAPSLGANGSYWRWTGETWALDRPFDIFRGTGATGAGLGTPVDVVNGPVVGFNRFGPAFPLPVAFFPVGVRLIRVRARILRTTNLGSLTMTTQVRLGGVVVYSAPWANNVILHDVDFEMWASAATQITAEGQLTLTTTVATPVATVAIANIETAVANLDTAAMSLEIGINDTVAEAGLLKLVHVSMEVLR